VYFFSKKTFLHIENNLSNSYSGVGKNSFFANFGFRGGLQGFAKVLFSVVAVELKCCPNFHLPIRANAGRGK
jgi:hypothetical protein